MVTMKLPYASCQYTAWSVVAAVVLGILLLVWLLTESSKHKNLPPGPRRLPIIGTLHLLGKYPQQDLAKLSKTYGPLMSIWMGPKLAVIASSPAAAEEILKTQGHNFSDRLRSAFRDKISPNDVVLASDSPKVLHLKKILHLQLSTTKQLQLSENVRSEEIARVLLMIPQDGTPILVRGYIAVPITNILSFMVLKKRFMAVVNDGEHELEQVRNFRDILDRIAKYAQALYPGDFIPIMKWIDFQGFERDLQKLRVDMDAFMSSIIAEHVVQRKNGSSHIKDMVDVLLDQMEDKTLPFDISDANIDNTLWDAFVAGTTTATDTIEWAMAECIYNPNVMKKAQAELDSIVGKSRRVEDADIPNLKYLQAIVKETLRLHPVVPLLVPHVSKNACKVLGYDIPRGTPVFVNVAAIARDPSIWKDPTIFKPERFLDGMPYANIEFKGKHFELLPFGSGRRACAGIALGTTLVHILVASFLQSFDWVLPNDLQPMELDMSEAEGVGHILRHSLTAIPKARLSISSIVN